MIKLKPILLLGIGLLVSSFLRAQTTTVTFDDSNVIDAMVANGGVEQMNFGSQNEINAFHQVGQQIPMVFRTFIEYDMSSIPSGALIINAKLKLIPKAIDNTSDHSIYIERVNDNAWVESVINWNNQPAVSTVDQLAFTQAQTSNLTVQEFDVKSHVQYMVNNPALNHGWRIRLQNEQSTSTFGLRYHSSEATAVTNRPTLEVTYMMPVEIATTVNHCTPGNTDATLSATLTGGSSYGLSNIFFYKTNQDLSQRGKATIVNHKVINNVQYDAVTGTVTAENLEPGVYILRVLDAEYYNGSNHSYIFYKHILVGREGEVTSGILYPDYRYQENTTIAIDKPAFASPLDRANTNYHSSASLIPLRVADVPNIYEFASLIKYELDFDEQLEFSTAELQMRAWSKFYRQTGSSNAIDFTLITSDWEEEFVTWNTRPTVDPTLQLHLPMTTANGYDNVHTYDTLDIRPLVEYWQANPTENYGFELALETYGAPKYAQRSYKSARKNENYIKFEFTVKEAVAGTYDEETERGTIVVTAPEGHPLPYKYLLSYEPLPELSTIWTTIKDSIPVDSITFYRGDVSTTSFVFEDLDAEKYYVGVYDNDGVKILDGNAYVAPEVALLENTNVEFTNGSITKGSNGSTGAAMIDGMLRSSESGGFDFEVEELGGNYVIGFNNLSQPVPAVSADFEYALEVSASNSMQLLKGSTVLFQGPVAQGDRLRIYKQNNEIIFYQNEYELARTPILADEKADLAGVVLFKTALGKIKNVVKYEHYKPKILPLTVIPFNIDCGESLGTVRFAYSLPEYFGGTGTYTIKDANTNAIVTTGLITAGFIESSDLVAGEYKVEYTYTVGGATYIFAEYFTIGYQVHWTLLNDYFVEIEGTVNTIKGISLFDQGLAMSQNTLPGTDAGWMYFYTEFQKKFIVSGGGIEMYLPNVQMKVVNQDLETQVQVNVFRLGDGILNRYIWVVGDAGSAFGTYKDGEIKIKRFEAAVDDWQYEISFDGSLIPFSTVDETDGETNETFKLLAAAQKGTIYDSYASFCGFEAIRSYADLTKKLDGGYYLAPNGIVKFIYNEEYNDLDDQLTYTIYDANNTVAVSNDELAQEVVYGDNRYDMDFSTFTGDVVLANGVYVLEVVNEKNEKWYLRFKIINN